MNTFERVLSLCLACIGLANAQTAAPLKVYVFKSGDSIADNALIQLLTDSGYQASLGIRNSEFDGNAVRLSDYQTVVSLGGGGRMPQAGIVALAQFLQGSGGLVMD